MIIYENNLETYESFCDFLILKMKEDKKIYSKTTNYNLKFIFAKTMYLLYKEKKLNNDLLFLENLCNMEFFINEFNKLKKEKDLNLIINIKENLKICNIYNFEDYNNVTDDVKNAWLDMSNYLESLFYPF